MNIGNFSARTYLNGEDFATENCVQTHLSGENMVNFGSYYTKDSIVSLVYELLIKHIKCNLIKCNLNEYTILDTSCGYGSFLANDYVRNSQIRKIGADIDPGALMRASGLNGADGEALMQAREMNFDNTEFICHNSLMQVGDDGVSPRTKYGISQGEPLIIVGNPPYNDTTSIAKQRIKKSINIHPKLKTRDLGISFLRSYAEIEPDYVCILHPLSYLIKRANFNLLGEFRRKYRLSDGLVISSEEFGGTSPAKTYFPILIGFYEKSNLGMDYDYVNNFEFSVLEKCDNIDANGENLTGTKKKNAKKVSFGKMDSIGNYIAKYPNQKRVPKENAVAYFYTLRDINALRRSKTFTNKVTANTIFVTENLLHYYCYVDIFKKYIHKMPYYLGNCDVFIDNGKFLQIADCFVQKSRFGTSEFDDVIDGYFDEILSEFP